MTDPLDLLRQAASLHQAGRLAEAEPLYAAAVAALPDHPDALHLYGVLCAQTGRNARAIALIEAAIARRDGAPAYHANLARALRAEGRLDEAAASLRRAIALQPSADALFSLGNVLKQIGDTAEAITHYRDALALRPDFADARANLAAALEGLGDAGGALDQLRAALACAPADRAVLFNLARTEQARGAVAASVAGYRRALRVDPSFEDAAGNLGAALVDDGRAAEAVPLLRRHAALAPDRPDRLLHLATALGEAGDSDGALAAFRRLMALTPGDPTPWQRTAELFEAAGRLDGLTDTLVAMVRLGRRGRFHWKAAYYHLVRLCNTLLAAGRADRAAALLPPVVAAFRDADAELHAWALFLQGSLAARTGDAATARRLFAEARPHLPFLAHVSLEDEFARRVDALAPDALARSEDAFVLEATAAPGQGPVVVASCDDGYLRRFGPLFLASVDRFAAGVQAVHLHIVDPAPDTPAFLAGLSKRLRRVRLGWSSERSPDGLDGAARTTFYTFARFLRLPRLMALYQSPLLVADVDACVLADPAAFLEPLSPERPLALQYFPENLARLYDGVGGGLLVLLPEPSVVALFERVRRFLVSWTAERRLHYFLDQIALTAGTDDAIRRGTAPGILAIGTQGRLFRCGGGVFVQILAEKGLPGFDERVRALVDALDAAPPSPDPRLDRDRFLSALGIT